jgi:hypothetical protein
MHTQAKPESDSRASKKTSAATMALTAPVEVSDEAVKVRYEIRNESEQDTWIFMGFDKSAAHASVFMDEDRRTLVISSRPVLPPGMHGGPVAGRYVCFHPGKSQTETISLAIPVHPSPAYHDRREAQGLEQATRLTIEVSYYAGDLPGTIRTILTGAERFGADGFDLRELYDNKLAIFQRYFAGFVISRYLGGSLGFNQLNEWGGHRDDQVLIPHTAQALLKCEQVLRITVDGLLIRYEKKEDQPESYSPPALPPCTRVEIQCQPSMLEYFFPNTGQQSILSPAEKQALQSLRTIVVDDQERIKALAHDLSFGVCDSEIVRQQSVAHVVCYHDGERAKSFSIYNDESIITEGRYRFLYFEGFRSLRLLTPQIRPFELRVCCAANLKDLWHRFRLYHKADKVPPPGSSSKRNLYPGPTEWSDAIVRAYEKVLQDLGMRDEYIKKPFKCPGGTEGQCHYAMNPNCRPNSAPDTVLLFETKAGWNQHGGPELFTFDNHDPRGGCVLLNDGTVKFIRTTEELQQLRWR